MEEPYWEVNDDDEVIDMEAEEKLCNELITKEQAFNVIADNNYSTKMTLACYDALIDGIADCPAVDAEPKWIPVDERLPEKPFGCLVTVEDCVPSTGETFPNLYPFFVGYDGERWNDCDGEEIYFEVLAWMPLPRAYEGE